MMSVNRQRDRRCFETNLFRTLLSTRLNYKRDVLEIKASFNGSPTRFAICLAIVVRGPRINLQINHVFNYSQTPSSLEWNQ